jgi:hypothetical protein
MYDTKEETKSINTNQILVVMMKGSFIKAKRGPIKKFLRVQPRDRSVNFDLPSQSVPHLDAIHFLLSLAKMGESQYVDLSTLNISPSLTTIHSSKERS